MIHKPKIVQTIIQITLFSLSTYMSILMFILIGDSIESKIAMGLLAFIFEVTKLTDLKKLTSKSHVKVPYVISYSCKTLLSVIASLGLILTLLSAQDIRTEARTSYDAISTKVIDNDIDYWKNEISKLDSTIQLVNENIDRLPEGYGLAGTSFVNQIKDLQALKVEYKNNLDLAVTNKIEILHESSQAVLDIKPTDMFTELSDIINVNDKLLRMTIFIMIIILIELSLALSTVSLDMTSNVLSSTKKNIKNIQSFTTQDSLRGLSIDLNISENAIKSSLAVAQKQAFCEKKGLHLYTQKMLAKELNTTPVNINNIIRRYIKPMMDYLKVDTFSDLSSILKRKIS